jgi:hypothetical protein
MNRKYTGSHAQQSDMFVAGSINFQVLMKSNSRVQRRCVAYHLHFISCSTEPEIVGISEDSKNVTIGSDFLLSSTFGCG